ncbi:MAG: DnaJ domain-containing protein [bacterium]|nr:DnaJ domain-containing protein [bacterium]
MKKWLVFFLLISPSIIFGEEITIYGIPFRVDEISKADDTLTRITFDGVSKLITSSNLETEVLRANIQSKSQPLDLKNLSIIAENAQIDSKIELSQVALFGILTNWIPSSNFDLARLLQRIGKTPSGPTLFTDLWNLDLVDSEKEKYSAETSAILYFYALKAGIVLPAKNISTLFKDTLLLKIRSELEESILNTGTKDSSEKKGISDIEKIFHILKDLKNSDQLGLTAVLNDYEVSLKALQAEKNLDIDSLYTVYSKASSNSYLMKLLEPTISRTLHKKAQSLLDKDLGEEAVYVLKDIPSQRRTLSTYSLLIECLARVPQSNSIIASASIETFLMDLSLRSEEIKSAYAALLRRSLAFESSKKNWEVVNKVMTTLKNLSGNQTELVHLAMMDVVLAASKSGDKIIVNKYIEDYGLKLSILEKFRIGAFSTIGYIVFGLGIFSLLVIGIIGAAILSLRRKQYKKKSEIFSVSKNLDPLVILTTSELGELKSCLSRFNLGVGASIDELKLAFRNSVKKVHPDVNETQSDEEFIKLNQAYDRIVELFQKCGAC